MGGEGLEQTDIWLDVVLKRKRSIPRRGGIPLRTEVAEILITIPLRPISRTNHVREPRSFFTHALYPPSLQLEIL